MLPQAKEVKANTNCLNIKDAEDVKRQKAVVVVITAEVAALLIAVGEGISRVEIQNQLGRRFLELSDELLDGSNSISVGKRGDLLKYATFAPFWNHPCNLRQTP